MDDSCARSPQRRTVRLMDWVARPAVWTHTMLHTGHFVSLMPQSIVAKTMIELCSWLLQETKALQQMAGVRHLLRRFHDPRYPGIVVGGHFSKETYKMSIHSSCSGRPLTQGPILRASRAGPYSRKRHIVFRSGLCCHILQSKI